MEGRDWLRKLRAGLGGKRLSPANYPAFYRSYLETFNRPQPVATPIDELDLVVFDAETTGLDVKEDRLLSLGGIVVRNGTIHVARQLELYVPTPEGYADDAAVRIHGILPASRRYAQCSEDAALAQLLEFLGRVPLIGHHIGFDVAILNQSLRRLGAGPLRNQVIDTARLAERLQPAGYWSPPEAYSLDALARRYGIPLSGRHTATGDAFITALLFLKLTGRLRARKGRPLTLADLRPA